MIDGMERRIKDSATKEVVVVERGEEGRVRKILTNGRSAAHG